MWDDWLGFECILQLFHGHQSYGLKKQKTKKKKMMHYQRFQIKNEAGLKKHMYSHTEVILEGKVCLI